MDSKGTTFEILKNHASTPTRKERFESNEQSKEGGQLKKFMEKCRVSDRDESCREVGSSKNSPRVRPGFIEPIRNGLRKEQNLI